MIQQPDQKIQSAERNSNTTRLTQEIAGFPEPVLINCNEGTTTTTTTATTTATTTTVESVDKPKHDSLAGGHNALGAGGLSLSGQDTVESIGQQQAQTLTVAHNTGAPRHEVSATPPPELELEQIH